jgi:ribosomal protein S18 acetylase RimI-like enzyme
LDGAFQDELDDFDAKKTFFPVVAKINHKIVGYVAFNPPDEKGKVYVRELAVAPEARRKGIGKKLIDYANSFFLGQIKQIRLGTRAVNVPARKFYTEKLGFVDCDDEDLFAQIPAERRHLYVCYKKDVMPSVHIRPATEQDLPTCVNLTRQVYDKVYRPFYIHAPDYFNKTYKAIDTSIFEPFFSQKIGQLLVAENEQKQVIGCLQALPFFIVDKSAEHWQAFKKFESGADLPSCDDPITKLCDGTGVYVLRFYVDEAWRSKGVGKKLLKEVKSYFKNAQKMYLDTYAANAKVLTWYNKLGFMEISRCFVDFPSQAITMQIDMDVLRRALEL